MVARMLPFVKMHGLGNSYIYIDAIKHSLDQIDLPALAKKVSCPGKGIGSDGLIVIAPSTKAAVKMRIFNKDGSEAKNCGNGLRCVAKYAFENGYTPGKIFTIETLGGVVEAEIEKCDENEAWVGIKMGQPTLERKKIPMQGNDQALVISECFAINGHDLVLTAVSMGNPHAVFFVEDFKEDPHMVLGPLIEKDERFPEGVNVEFVRVQSPSSLVCKVWERGSGITKACGTGACASVVAAILNGFSKKKTWIDVQLMGGVLNIRWDDDGITMKGPATKVAEGFLYKSL